MEIKLGNFIAQITTPFIMKQFAITFLLLTFIGLTVYSQDYWKTYRVEDGLLTDSINQLSVDEDKVYLATQKGFSVFENERFTNYDASNSSLKSNRIALVKHFKDTVWLVSDSGLSKFYNGTFTHFDTAVGFPTAEINSLEIDSKGQVWLGSLQGLSWLNGDTIYTDDSRSIYSIVINKGDSIYANVNFPQINSSGTTLVTFEVYYNGIWNEPTYTTPGLGDGKFVTLSDSSIGVVTNTHGSFIIDDGFNFNNVVPVQDALLSFYTTCYDLDIDTSGRYWMPYSYNLFTGYRGVGIKRVEIDSVETLSLGLPQKSIVDIEANQGLIYLASYDGFAISSQKINTYKSNQKLETSVLEATIGADGLLFSERDEFKSELETGFEFPKNSGKNLIKNASLWFYGLDESGKEYVSVNNTIVNDFEEGTINDNQALINFPHNYIKREDIRYHLKNFNNSNYQMPESIKNWGASSNPVESESDDLAPYVDVNENGCYDPENGDYPYMVGDEAIYFVYNDLSDSYNASITTPLGLEIHGMAYVYERNGLPFLSHSVFFKYFIVNRSANNYVLSTALDFDFDIGNASDDYFGCSPKESIFYAYNNDSNDEGVYGDTIPSVGVKVFNRDLDKFIGYGAVGPPYGIIYNNEIHYRNIMKGKWTTGKAITIGGTGYDISSTDTTTFIFPGDPQSPNEWSMLHPYQNQNSLPFSFLQQTLGVVEPVELRAGQRMQLDFVVGVGIDSNNQNWLDNIDVLHRNLNNAARFQQGIDSIGPEYTYSNCSVGINPQSDLNENYIKLYPNPAKSQVFISSNKRIERISVYNLRGVEMYRRNFLDESKRTLFIPIENWASGFYIVSIQDKLGGRIAKKMVISQ